MLKMQTLSATMFYIRYNKGASLAVCLINALLQLFCLLNVTSAEESYPLTVDHIIGMDLPKIGKCFEFLLSQTVSLFIMIYLLNIDYYTFLRY